MISGPPQDIARRRSPLTIYAIWVLSGAILMTAGLWLALRTPGSRHVKTQDYTARRANLQNSVFVTGWRRSPVKITQAASQSGVLVTNQALHVGTSVQPGTPLFKVNQVGSSQSLQAAQDQWNADQATVRSAEAQVRATKDQLAQAVSSAQNALSLQSVIVANDKTALLNANKALQTATQNGVSSVALIGYKNNVATAQSQWNQDQAKLRIDEAQLAQAKGAATNSPSLEAATLAVTKDVATAQGAYAAWQALVAQVQTIASSVNGTVLSMLPSGSSVSAGETVMVLSTQHTSPSNWKGFLPITYAKQVQVGDAIVLNGKQIGVVRVIQPTPITYNQSSGFWFYAHVFALHHAVLSGLPTSLQIRTALYRHVVVVPSDAYRVVHNHGGVYVRHNGHWVFHRVHVLARNARQIAISQVSQGSVVATGVVGS